MRIFALPAQQDAFNIKLNRSVRLLMIAAVLCLVATVSLLASAWWMAPHGFVNLPSVIGPGGEFIGSGIVLTPEYAICLTNSVPAHSSLEFRDHSRIPLMPVRVEALTPETSVALLHLQQILPDGQAAPGLAEASTGIRAEAASSDMVWRGTLQETRNGLFDTQPAISIGSGAPIYDAASRSFIGVTATFQGAPAVISTQNLLKAFPELRSSH